MALAAFHAGAGKASWLWLFGFFAVLTVGELYLSPVGLSFVTKVAPAAASFDADGRVACVKLHRRFSGRLARQLLERDDEARVFSDDRRDRRDLPE